MQRNNILVMFIQIAPVHSKFDIDEKLTEDDAAAPKSPLLPPPHFIY